MRLSVVPIYTSAAKRWMATRHRHNKPPVQALFACAVADAEGVIHGVALAERPKAEGLCDGSTVEISRVCTDGARNACSMLYGAMRRAAFALGYTRVVTYTLQEESGASLRASGWTIDAEIPARPSWSHPSRPRDDTDMFGTPTRPSGPKRRWVCART